MSSAAAELAARARAWGVDTVWRDTEQRVHEVPTATLEAILDALGAGAGTGPSVEGPLVVRRGRSRRLEGARAVRLEDGGELSVADGRLPADLPLGYHRVVHADGRERVLVVSPGRCHVPAGLRTWGLAVQLYSLHSAQSWGIGDLGDLGELAAWARGLEAGLALVSPLHFGTPQPPVGPSPYSPGSRRFRDPIHLRVGQVPGVDAAAAVATDGSPTGRIDRDAVLRRKLAALGVAWERTAGSAAAELERWRAEQPADLDAFGGFCALAEVHGNDWRTWPAALRDRHSPTVAAAVAKLRDRADFHVWLQWLLDRQVAAVAAELPLLHDLAIGVDPGGADAWLQPDALVAGVHIGAPPDAFNTRGQDWGIAPFDPWQLRSAAYQPFVEVVRACLRGAGGLRVDHVMGLSRLFWVPRGATPAEGAYVRYPAADLFDVLALESVRARALVVGEDLGTVQASVRREMAARDILSYRLLWFEADPPRDWPARALAAVTTHDLPTVAGLWSGADLRDQVAAGTSPDPREQAALHDHLRAVAGLDEHAGVEAAVLGAYAALGEAPCAVLLATLEDMLLVERRPNLPGTTADRWPSWSLPLPASVEEIAADPRARRIAGLLRRGPVPRTAIVGPRGKPE